MRDYNPADSDTAPSSRTHRKLLLVALPILALLLIGTGAYAAINLSSQKPAQHTSLKPAINLDQGEKGLVGWWKLNGNAKDSTPYQDNGTLVNGPTPTADRKGTPNGAYSFNGTSYISVPNFNSTVLMSGQEGASWSLSVWAKANGPQSTQGVLLGKDGYNAGILRPNNTQYRFGMWGSTGGSVTITATVDTSQWHLLTATYAARQMEFYVDGSLAGTATGPASMHSYSNVLGIGSGGGGSYAFNGSLSDARIYNRALSQQDITNLYNSYNSQVNLCSAGTASCTVNLTAGLIGYWPFNGNTNDATPYQDNGVVNGATLTTNRFGTPNTAYAFNGNGDYIAVPSSRFNLTNNFSLAAWIDANPDANINYAIISSWRSTDGGQNWWFHRQRSGLSNHLSFQVNVGRSQVTTSSSINANSWYYVTFVLNSGVAQLYVNGNLAATSTNFGTIVSGNTGGLRIGGTNSADTTAWFNGSIDQVRVYNRPLNSTEVQALYNLPD
ncbi:MAG TPA: LamG domain-containing protein [Candidatus Saccharimonadales bacterium]|nr:LamG domain-containing protein [Candidatus Saccharimonadales bacterium]